MKYEENKNTLICHFDMEVNTLVCNEISQALSDRVAEAQKRISDLRLDFDLSETRYICSLFLRLCLRYCKQVDTANFNVTNVSDDVYEVFETTAITDIISVSKR
ncbi:MAG: STAS domain-containing protein [Planctomycetaceae bacterium]|jgi:hypothetical protein|nr:STAS domain-containing protein [Planctomycetaceae bacterium]